MSVLSCSRNGCTNIMCDRYSYRYGYICNDCFEELKNSDMTPDMFLFSVKGGISKWLTEARLEYLEEEFKIQG